MHCGIPYEVYHGERKVLAEEYMHVSVPIQPGGLFCVGQHQQLHLGPELDTYINMALYLCLLTSFISTKTLA